MNTGIIEGTRWRGLAGRVLMNRLSPQILVLGLFFVPETALAQGAEQGFKQDTPVIDLGVWGSRGTIPGKLQSPGGIAVDGNEFVYVADTGNDRIQKFSTDGVFLDAWVDNGLPGGEFSQPMGVDVDALGNVYVADTGNNRIRKFDNTGGSLWRPDEGDTAVPLNSPIDVAVDLLNNVYVLDRGNNRVVKISRDGVEIGAFSTQDDGAFQFENLNGIAVDAVDNVYVSDSENDGRVLVFNSAGVLSDIIGTLGQPLSVTLPTDSINNGIIFVLDGELAKVQRYDSATRLFLDEWGGNGPGEFNAPVDFDIDSDGRIYVLDQANHNVRIFAIGDSPTVEGEGEGMDNGIDDGSGEGDGEGSAEGQTDGETDGSGEGEGTVDGNGEPLNPPEGEGEVSDSSCAVRGGVSPFGTAFPFGDGVLFAISMGLLLRAQGRRRSRLR